MRLLAAAAAAADALVDCGRILWLCVDALLLPVVFVELVAVVALAVCRGDFASV